MARSDHYNKVVSLTEEAINYIERKRGNYKGYAGANAISLYLDEVYGINVTCDDEGQRAFTDVMLKQREEAW